jgi:hypothetical protein
MISRLRTDASAGSLSAEVGHPPVLADEVKEALAAREAALARFREWSE